MKVLYNNFEVPQSDYNKYVRVSFDEQGNVIVRPKTQLELNQPRIDEIIKRLEELTKDFAQVQAGFEILDIEERKKEFRTLLNEVRELQGKEPKTYNL